MRSRTLTLLALAGLLIAAPVAAAGQAPCCDTNTKNMSCAKADCDMPCCKHDADAVGVLLSIDPAIDAVAVPARQETVVWFMRPVTVGRHILQGHYVIEHDNDRMARGEPCTHIYAFEDRTKPVVAFHCTHLVRDPAAKNVVVLQSLGDGWQRLTEFQFQGDTASHGVPSGR